MLKRVLPLLLIIGSSICIQAQESTNKPFDVDVQYFYGNLIEHSKDIAHLITEHPKGLLLSYNRKTYGLNEWERRYNYPDWGFSFMYQDFGNEFVGKNYSLFGHYSFYFLNRKLQFRIGQGIAYNTNPFDIDTNKKNNAFGTHLLSATYLLLNYKQQLTNQIHVQGGLTLTHYSNGNARAPNTSLNTIAANIGLTYVPKDQGIPPYIALENKKYTEPIRYNFVLRGGANESDRLGLGQHPFFIASAFVDKRISYKSTLQAGIDVFFARFLKEQIEFEAVAFPQFGTQGDEDWRRVGLFIGHELRFGRVAFVSQLGYYVYYPYDFEGRIYERIGLKRYFGDHFFGAVTVKAHGSKAEAVEFGIGYRL
ncbi:acyloxyacyl hydrolase [Dokdonia pacifica]|uniref:Lipid A 3-O-deacylase (PagL) n=1 Tax=Dokdonia pacifica TaxID=1627892 RepID=A0A238YSV0_9FLAO|nr:acyloxyacyl hydrolase [Dokdonia pacifica]SNR74120.1 Lipid A 3-O-deacylase (PagL) [Dokdonia pacifica]